jgi:hypothetical protein
MTSREAPPELTGLGGSVVPIFELGGPQSADGQLLLTHNHLLGNSEQWSALTSRFGGNGLALKIVGERIRQQFGGDSETFLNGVWQRLLHFGAIWDAWLGSVVRGCPENELTI